jgi:hypothetical protein
MTTVTLEAPDALAARLNPLRTQQPKLFALVLELLMGETCADPFLKPPPFRVFQELLDFLAAGPTAQQIITHKVSAPVQERLEALLNKNREAGLTEDEKAEMEAFSLVNHVMIILKSHARRGLL